MQTTINHLDKNEVLRYLGYQGTGIPEPLDRLIDQCIAHTLSVITPKYLYRRFPVTKQPDGIHVSGTNILLTGNDICALLENCKEIYLLCVTIGLGLEKTIRTKMLTAPDEGVIYDSCGSTAVEHVADYVEHLITKECAVDGLNLTWRYSAGYGDLPLETQKSIITAMDTHRRIGLSLNSSLLLTPNKSVTAIIGVSNTASDERANKCDYCNNREHCAFRKRGLQC